MSCFCRRSDNYVVTPRKNNVNGVSPEPSVGKVQNGIGGSSSSIQQKPESENPPKISLNKSKNESTTQEPSKSSSALPSAEDSKLNHEETKDNIDQTTNENSTSPKITVIITSENSSVATNNNLEHDSDSLSNPTASEEKSSGSFSMNQEDRKESVSDLLGGSRISDSANNNSGERRPGVEASIPAQVEDNGNEKLPVYAKSPKDEEIIKTAIEKNDFLSKILSGKRLEDIINAMQLKNVPAKKTLIKQGDKGSEMFVSKEGKFRILIKGKAVGEFNDSRVFGELAILYNAKRLATIQAVTTGKVWVLDRRTYQKVVISSNLKEQEETLRFLQNIQDLNVVDVGVLRQVSNLLKPEFFPSGTVIIRQGDKGDKFYIIRAGTVTISKTGEGVLGTRVKGECFGEMALQKEDTRQATVTAEPPGVECLTLTRRNFVAHFGDVQIPTIKVEPIKDTPTGEIQSEYQHIRLEDLSFMKTLGVGGFGRVELVQYKKNKKNVFALKYLKKIDIVYQNQQEHVYNEKRVQMSCRSPFIVRLYRTYKDDKYVFFLMELCLGGDLFSLLHRQKGKRFQEDDAKFLSGCVLEALAYLHSKGIIYRDLKPENLLVDKNGYLKLTDFGFAKEMPVRGKTFTFAGTPEYVAPEIVLNRGHDRAVDYWAFGAFVFELLTGRTPFRTGDPGHMRTYNKILNGIDNVNFPTTVGLKAKNLIEKLCRPVPSERLGMQRGGPMDIKNHKWYQDFDWVKLQQLGIQSKFKPHLKDHLDTRHIDDFKQDKNYPPPETSGWDKYF